MKHRIEICTYFWLKSQSNAKNHQWEIFWLFVAKKWMQQATAGVGLGCFAYQTQKSNLSLMRYWFLVVCSVKQQKVNATSNLRYGPFESNQTQINLSSMRDCFLVVCCKQQK